jgi:hypothetical protein
MLQPSTDAFDHRPTPRRRGSYGSYSDDALQERQASAREQMAIYLNRVEFGCEQITRAIEKLRTSLSAVALQAAVKPPAR